MRLVDRMPSPSERQRNTFTTLSLGVLSWKKIVSRFSEKFCPHSLQYKRKISSCLPKIVRTPIFPSPVRLWCEHEELGQECKERSAMVSPSNLPWIHQPSAPPGNRGKTSWEQENSGHPAKPATRSSDRLNNLQYRDWIPACILYYRPWNRNLKRTFVSKPMTTITDNR